MTSSKQRQTSNTESTEAHGAHGVRIEEPYDPECLFNPVVSVRPLRELRVALLILDNVRLVTLR